MIRHLDIQPFDVIRKLAYSNYIFFPFGSRDFGYAKLDSDWDFYAQDSKDIRTYLEKNDFEKVPMNPDWLDDITHTIYSKQGVHIVLVSDILTKHKAVKYIKRHSLIYDRLKLAKGDERKGLWNRTYQTVLEEEKNVF